MDFDDLEDQEVEAGVARTEPAWEPELLTILEKTNAPVGLRNFLDEEGLTTCKSFSEYVQAQDDDEVRKECDKLAAKLKPEVLTTREVLAVRNALRRCRRAAEPPSLEPEAAKAPEAAAAAAPKPEAAKEPEAAAEAAPKDVVAAEAAPKDVVAAEARAEDEPEAEAAPTEAPEQQGPWDGGPAGKPYHVFIDDYMGWVMQGYRGHTPGRPPKEPHWPTDADFEARRAVAEANREMLEKQGVKPLSPFQKMTMNDLEAKCKKVLNGEMYGLPVPVNLDDLKKRGEKYLTQVFHAAGTLPKDNSVKKIVEFKRLPMTGKEAAGGSGPKAFLTLQYEKSDPDLHTQLFAKMPWDMGTASVKTIGNSTLSPKEQAEFYRLKEKGIDPYYRWKCSATADYEAQESTIYRFLGPIFPFKIPKYYFADICRENTNYILITEKIAYPKKGEKKDPAPYEILPVAEKYFDFQLQPRMRYEMYYAIMRAQARMAAWDKLGFFEVAPQEMRGIGMAPPPLGYFEWPQKLPAKRRAAKVRAGEGVAKLWTEFLTDKAKPIYETKYTGGEFLEALCQCCREFVGYKDDIFLYCCLFPDMIALQHTNLQSDNAYYWYNDSDEMDAGLIDWGGASPGSFTSRMSGSITSAEGSVLDEHEDGFLRCFITEYYRECGIQINFDEFKMQWMLWYCNYLYSMGSNIEMEIFRETPREMWSSIKSMWDDKAAGRWNVRCYVFMIHHALEYLHLRWTRKGGGRLHCHDSFLEWKEYWESKGLQ